MIFREFGQTLEVLELEKSQHPVNSFMDVCGKITDNNLVSDPSYFSLTHLDFQYLGIYYLRHADTIFRLFPKLRNISAKWVENNVISLLVEKFLEMYHEVGEDEKEFFTLYGIQSYRNMCIVEQFLEHNLSNDQNDITFTFCYTKNSDGEKTETCIERGNAVVKIICKV